MLETLAAFNFEIISFLSVGFILGILFMLMAVVDAVAKTKRARAIAEFRRQKRLHEATLAREKEAHAIEIAVLREQLRDQAAGTKPFDAIVACRIEPVRLMNRGEFRLWKTLEEIAARLPGQPLVFPQVPLGEVLRVAPSSGTDAERRRASQELQGKRVDAALTDRSGRLLVAIELQGNGHYQGTAAWRDQIKQALFRRADLPLIEVFPDVSSHDLEKMLRHALGHRTATSDRQDRAPTDHPVYQPAT